MAVSEKILALTRKLENNIAVADSTDDINKEIIEIVDDSVVSDNTVHVPECYFDIINVNQLLEDLTYIRTTLKAITETAKRVLNNASTDLYNIEEEQYAAVLNSLSNLNRSIADNLKLYLSVYRDLSNVIINLEKTKNGLNGSPVNVNVNQKQINNIVKTTSEIISELRG